MGKKPLTEQEAKDLSYHEFVFVLKLYEDPKYEGIIFQRIAELELPLLSEGNPEYRSIITEKVRWMSKHRPGKYFKMHLHKMKPFQIFADAAAEKLAKDYPALFFEVLLHKDSKYEELALKTAMSLAKCHPETFMNLKLDKGDRFKEAYWVVLKNLDKL